MPDSKNLEATYVIAPHLEELLSAELVSLNKESIRGVTDEDVKKRIKQRLARLFEREKDPVDVLPESFWTVLEGKVSEVDHQKALARLLERLVCEDETSSLYVAQGIIKTHRIKSIGPDNLPGVARKLLDNAEGRTTDCPGLKGLNAESIAKLRQWAVKPIEVKSQEKPKPEDKAQSPAETPARKRSDTPKPLTATQIQIQGV